jgi:hypothetical protein
MRQCSELTVRCDLPNDTDTAGIQLYLTQPQRVSERSIGYGVFVQVLPILGGGRFI